MTVPPRRSDAVSIVTGCGDSVDAQCRRAAGERRLRLGLIAGHRTLTSRKRRDPMARDAARAAHGGVETFGVESRAARAERIDRAFDRPMLSPPCS
jgi:hypothetical protein